MFKSRKLTKLMSDILVIKLPDFIDCCVDDIPYNIEYTASELELEYLLDDDINQINDMFYDDFGKYPTDIRETFSYALVEFFNRHIQQKFMGEDLSEDMCRMVIKILERKFG